MLAIMLAASALWSIGGPQNAQAQTQETTIIISNFFAGRCGGAQLGAQEKLKAALDLARKCPSNITVEYWFHLGDYGAQTQCGRERQESFYRLVDELASDVEFRRLYKSDTDPTHEDVNVRWTPKPDQEKPKLDVIWTPSKGTKVKPDGKITAKVTARDDAAPAQTGVARIRVDIGIGGGLVAAPAQYPPPIPLQECGRQNPVRTYEATYTVPSNPPPVVQLRANARDFAGNETWEDAKFPTSDWFGSIKKQAKGAGHNHTVDVDFAFEIETSGVIRGRARARVTTEEGQVPACTILWTYSPSEFEIPLSGRRDGENFEISLEPGTTTATVRTNCTGSQGSHSSSQVSPVAHGLNKFRISAQDGAKNTVESSAGALPWGVIMRDTIEIHQTRQ
jgi:hypothetical protein